MTDPSRWDKELAKIDRQINSMPDEALTRGSPPVGGGGARAPAPRPATSTIGVYARVGLATALGVGMLFWPYSARCGAGLAIYLVAVGVLLGSGIWSSIWTWRHRASRMHLLSLLLVLWGGILGAVEVLPRVGYAVPTPSHPAAWSCVAQ